MTIPLSNARTGGQLLVDQLLVHGSDMAFCVPGESYLEVLDALFDARDRIKLVNARHEAGAANMAEALHLHGDAGAGRLPCCGRRAHRVPGFDPDDIADRAGWSRHDGPRGISGN